MTAETAAEMHTMRDRILMTSPRVCGLPARYARRFKHAARSFPNFEPEVTQPRFDFSTPHRSRRFPLYLYLLLKAPAMPPACRLTDRCHRSPGNDLCPRLP
jgi:hypothetical protein